MNKKSALFVFILLSAILCLAGAAASATIAKLPLVDGKEAVAVINGEPITRAEYEEEINSLHSSMSHEATPGEKKPGKIDYAAILKRLIDTRLILQESRNIGLGELPEVQELLKTYNKKTLRTVLLQEAVKNVQPDEAAIAKIYRDAIAEWKFSAVMFKNKEDAEKMQAEIKAGKNFLELAEKAIADGKAKGGKDTGYLKNDKIQVSISNALFTMGTGSISPLIPVSNGYAIVKLEDVRYPESAEQKEEARKEAIRQKRSQAMDEYTESIIRKNTKSNKDLIDSLNFGASVEEFEKLAKDKRAIVEIEGEDPITVADLADALRQGFFHGIEREIGKRDLTEKKYKTLDELIKKRALLKEAAVQNIQNTEAYQLQVKAFENAVLFGVFIQKIIEPDIKIPEQDARAYYEKHRADYTSPKLIRLDSIVFKKRGDAEVAMQRLRAGDQIGWLKENAEGQVESDAEDLVPYGGNVFAADSLPEEAQKALVNSNAGDIRLYESSEGYFYVLSVAAVYPAKTEDFMSVSTDIVKRIYDERLKKGVADWADKLRAAADIKIYLKD